MTYAEMHLARHTFRADYLRTVERSVGDVCQLCPLNEECAGQQRTVREQSRRRKMRTLEPRGGSQVAYFPILAYLAFEHDTAVIADDDQSKRRAGLTGLCGTEEVHHLGSESAGYVLIAQGVRRPRPLILELRAGWFADVSHRRISPSGS